MIILNGTYMWTNFILLVAQVFKSSGFTGAIYIWSFGLPIFITFIIFASDDKLKVLSTKVNEFKKGEEVQRYIRYFLEMVSKRGKDRSVDIHLKGFVYNHEENCTISDCPLKKFKKQLDKSNHKEPKNHKEGNDSSATISASTHHQHQSGSGHGGGHVHGQSHNSKNQLI
jgi:hypothetical protein